MDSAKTQLVDKLKTSNNVLVTVSRNPSVDQLSALLGLTLLLNKLDKHAAAVYSGETPAAIEFLDPSAVIEKNTDSLRDFIIALDKNKADKLRYKVEDDVVRIFITPYKTSISQEDFDFSQGDFNVDVVIAIGVHQQEDLDEAITAHGRILHDATVASINNTPDVGLGSIVWQDEQASSLSELVTDLVQTLAPDQLDNQNATALLTGIVAETERFSNQKTTSFTMSASAALMAAGADQQLVATKLNEPEPELSDDSDNQAEDESADDTDDQGGEGNDQPEEPAHSDDGTIEINHNQDHQDHHDNDQAANDDEQPDQTEAVAQDDTASSQASQQPDQTEPAEEPAISLPAPEPEQSADDYIEAVSDGPKLVTEPPTMGGMLSANTQPERLDPSTDPLSLSGTDNSSVLMRDKPENQIVGLADVPADGPEASAEQLPVPEAWTPPAPANVAPAAPVLSGDSPAATLSDLEASIHSQHLEPAEHVDDARDEVSKALNTSSYQPAPPPTAALNAQQLGDDLHPSDVAEAHAEVTDAPFTPPPVPNDQPSAGPSLTPPTQTSSSEEPLLPGFSADPTPPPPQLPSAESVNPPAPQVTDANPAPPPVPPPLPPAFNNLPQNANPQQ